jgi:uncharacterized membrane protein YcaP (DUF421 family)
VLFSTWADLLRVVLVGTLAYVALVAFVRVSGKRTLAKMNAFDLVVTVAMGSTLATVLLSRDVPLAVGITGFAVLIGMQFLVAWVSTRSALARRITRGEPRLLVHRGELLESSLRLERITHDEVLAAVRQAGIGGLTEVEAVVLETDGSISVVASSHDRRDDAIRNVKGPPQQG